jgi:hypothetical protein
MAPIIPPIIVPAVVLSPGLLLAALCGVTQPLSTNNADPASAEDKSFMVSSLNQANFCSILLWGILINAQLTYLCDGKASLMAGRL